MWNDEIKHKIIDELNEEFETTDAYMPTENHSYADSIFSYDTSNMFRPISNDILSVPNYFETTISRTRAIKEVPVHTLAFSDSFNAENSMETTNYMYSPSTVTNDTAFSGSDASCDMDKIIHSPSTVTFSLSPEQRGVAIAKRVTWKEIIFEDASLIKDTQLAKALKKFCSIQIKI